MTGEGVVINLSLPGCAVESATPLPIGSRIELHLLLPIHFFPVAVDHAEVVWSSDARFGVKFLRIRSGDEARLQRLIEQYLRHDRDVLTCAGLPHGGRPWPAVPMSTGPESVFVAFTLGPGGPRYSLSH